MPRLLDDPVAHWLVVTTAVATVIGEIVATYLGHARDGERRLRGSLADSLLLYVQGRGTALRRDRGTRLIVALTVYLGIAAALAIARVPALRVYANNWWTLGLGVGIVLVGAALRDWAILSLSRYFRREVTIEPGQRIVRRGPYRVLRHPSYTGIFLIFAGFGLAVGAGSAPRSSYSSSLPRCCRAFGSRNARSHKRSARTTRTTRTRRRVCSRTSGSRTATGRPDSSS